MHIYLEYSDSVSDKFYRLTVGQTPGGNWVTNAQWGRRGSTGQSQAKYVGPSESEALRIAQKFAYEKRAKGYVDALDPLRPAAPSAPAITVAPSGVASSVPASPASSQPSGVPRFAAMKAAETNVDWAQLTNFVMEEKFDGHRGGLVFNPDGTYVVRNVYGEDKGRMENVPHIKQHLQAIEDNALDVLAYGTLIDGEFVGLTLEETGHLLGAGGRTDPRLRFVAFDLPFYAGKDLRGESWLARRELLHELFHTAIPGPIELVALYPPTFAGVEGIWARGGEGAILKPIDSSYVPGGRADWIKIKEHHTADAVITGFDEGSGKYAGKVGALILSQLKSGRLTEVTKISGMTDSDRTHMTAFWDEWVGTVVEFEYQRKTDAGSYRHPRFSRRRLDKKMADCTWEASA